MLAVGNSLLLPLFRKNPLKVSSVLLGRHQQLVTDSRDTRIYAQASICKFSKAGTQELLSPRSLGAPASSLTTITSSQGRGSNGAHCTAATASPCLFYQNPDLCRGELPGGPHPLRTRTEKTRAVHKGKEVRRFTISIIQ